MLITRHLEDGIPLRVPSTLINPLEYSGAFARAGLEPAMRQPSFQNGRNCSARYHSSRLHTANGRAARPSRSHGSSAPAAAVGRGPPPPSLPGPGGGNMAVSGGVALLLGAVLGPFAASVFSSSPVGRPGEPRSRVQVLSGSNWSLVLQGQWMVEL